MAGQFTRFAFTINIGVSSSICLHTLSSLIFNQHHIKSILQYNQRLSVSSLQGAPILCSNISQSTTVHAPPFAASSQELLSNEPSSYPIQVRDLGGVQTGNYHITVCITFLHSIIPTDR